MIDDQQTRLHNQERKENENQKLWNNLKIEFRLEALGFPDNKVYGVVKVEPESSRQLIRHFEFIVNEKNRIEFGSHYYYIAASGFDTKAETKSWAYIEAIPENKNWANQKKISDRCTFYFTGTIFALSPTLSFAPSLTENDTTPDLVIKWYHIGDRHAHKYNLYLDNKKIQHIPQKSISDTFEIRICSLKVGDKHKFQLAAKLNNHKETYRSDLMEFEVPSQPTDQCITVSSEKIPDNIPAVVSGNGNIIEQLSTVKEPPPPTEKEERKMYTCCTQLPHDTFPGIEHYLNDNVTKSTNVNNNHKQEFIEAERTAPTKENDTNNEGSEEDEGESDDDSDDVIQDTKK